MATSLRRYREGLAERIKQIKHYASTKYIQPLHIFSFLDELPSTLYIGRCLKTLVRVTHKSIVFKPGLGLI